MRKLSFVAAMVFALGFGSLASAGILDPGEITFNPDLGMLPAYTSGLPAWVNAGGLADTLVAPMVGDFTGTVTSRVYFLNGVDSTGGLGFTYYYSLTDTPGATGLVRSSHAAAGWSQFDILDHGADGSGSSSSPGGVTTWTDGDPYFIERSVGAESPAYQWRFGTNGTQLLDGDDSAIIWFETNATDWDISNTDLLDSGFSGTAAVFDPVPAPGAVLLGGLGLSLVSWMRKRVA